MRLNLDLDAPRMALAAAVGGGAILSDPQMQMALAVLLAALASVAVDVLKAVGRWAVHRLTRDLPKVEAAEGDAVPSGDGHPAVSPVVGQRSAAGAEPPGVARGGRATDSGEQEPLARADHRKVGP